MAAKVLSEWLAKDSRSMKTLKLSHVIKCTPERFWEVFFDQEFNTWLYNQALSFNEFTILEQSEGPNVRRKVRGSPKVDLPGPIRKLVGDRFGYEEEGTFDAATKTWRFKMKPSAMADKMRMEGVVRVEAAGEGQCRRLAEITIEAKIFGVGKMIEGTSEKEMQQGWDDSAKHMNKWLADRAG